VIKKAIKKDDLDVSMPLNDSGPPQDINPDQNPDDEAPKWKPDGKFWTYYDGNPRNIIQNLIRFTKFPYEEKIININELEEQIYNSLSQHIMNWRIKSDSQKNYPGIISIIKYS
jgi:hypothetical protein